MKRILSTSLLLVAMVVAFTGCLKDKGFDNHTYGINDPDSQPPGVGFPLGSNARNNVGLDAGSTTLQQITNTVFVNIFGGVPAKSDVTVTLQLNDNLRTAYNAANGTNIVAMNPAHYSIPGLTITIPAGSMNGQIPINVPSTAVLNPNDSYGLGFTITAVSGGYRVAENFKNLFLVINLKNKYDGVYDMVMRHDNWQAYGISDHIYGLYPAEVHLITAGATTCTIDVPDGPFGNLQPGFSGGTGFITAGTAFGATTPMYTFNLATDDIIAVVNTTPDDGRGRTLFLNTSPTVGPNHYDASTKTMHIEYFMTQNGRPNQQFWTDWEYVRPR